MRTRAQQWPQMVPNHPKLVICDHSWPFLGIFGPFFAKKWGKMAKKWPKNGQKMSPNGPKWPKMTLFGPILAILGSFFELFLLTPYRYRDPIWGGLGPFGIIFGDFRRTHARQNIFPPRKWAIFSGRTENRPLPGTLAFLGPWGGSGPGRVRSERPCARQGPQVIVQITLWLKTGGNGSNNASA